MLRPFILCAAMCAAPLCGGAAEFGQVLRDDLPPVQARAALAQGSALEQDLLEWVMLRAGRDDQATSLTYSDLLERRDWPGADALHRKGESTLNAETPAAEVIAYFLHRDPQTPDGFAALLRALIAVEDEEAARARAKGIWPDLRVSGRAEAALLRDFATVLAPAQWARADRLLWQGQRDAARRLAPYLPSERRVELAARLAYLDGREDAGALDARVGLREGVAYARFRWLREAKQQDAAAQLFLDQAQANTLGRPGPWLRAVRRMVRAALREGQPLLAYDLARAAAPMAEGPERAEFLWLAGYAALSGLDAPEAALHQFTDLAQQVDTPVSQARALFWSGRAQMALGNQEAATTAWHAAARHWPAYYAQLAADRVGLDPPPLALPSIQESDHELARAILLLIAAEERGLAYVFMNRFAATAPESDLRALALQLAAQEEVFLLLRLGKGAYARGILLPEAYLPLHPVADRALPVEAPLALSIARQESEFRTDAGSSAGALGLMQLMPDTARAVAQSLGRPFQRARLYTDWAYNADLGGAYLHELIARFGDSPVLVAVGYNAGPGRARDWVGRFGDPRDEAIDPVDWVEGIPFDETRNYVMRVTEAMPAYAQRLGRPVPRLSDLLRGRYPLIRPRARPVLPAPLPVIRPIARP